MSNLRLWIVILALTCFGAGLGGGWLAAAHLPRASDAAPRGPFEEYQRRFAATFALTPERARVLGEVLADYSKKIEDLEQARLARSMSEMEGDLQQLGLTYGERIRDHVLPPESRAKYDALAAPAGGAPWGGGH